MRSPGLGHRLFPGMRTAAIERPSLDEPPTVDMPPMNVIRCQCKESCPLSDPCKMDATQEDFLCDPCREAKRHAEALRSGVFSTGMVDAVKFIRNARESLAHCHQCDPQFNYEGGEEHAPS